MLMLSYETFYKNNSGPFGNIVFFILYRLCKQGFTVGL